MRLFTMLSATAFFSGVESVCIQALKLFIAFNANGRRGAGLYSCEHRIGYSEAFYFLLKAEMASWVAAIALPSNLNTDSLKQLIL